MRIDTFNKINQVYQTSNIKRNDNKRNNASSDQLEISQTGKEYHIVKKAVADIPDVRMDKVNSIKQAMASGTYNISSEEVAGKIVDSYYDTII